MIRARIAVFLTVSLLFLLPSLGLGQEIYIWTDDQGIRHIEDKPPKIAPGKSSVEKYRPESEKPSDMVIPAIDETRQQKSEQQVTEPGKASEIAQDREKQQREEAIKKARLEYEEAKESERYYRIRDKNLDNERTHYLWKQSQRLLEESRQRLEELEKNQ